MLPYEIEHQYPDYGLYGIHDCCYGHLTRGCPRGCPFCIVKEKEGDVHTVADINQFWHGQKNIVIMDSNITASRDCERLFDDLIKTNAWIDFEGGLDIRFLTDKGAEQLNRMKIKMIHFAWDNYEFKTYEQLKRLRPLLKYDDHKLCVYVLVNFNTQLEQDLERIYKLRELDCWPYVMVYDKPNAPKIIKDLQRWCNNVRIARTVKDFNDYRANRKGE